MQAHYTVADVHVRLTRAGPTGEIILARDDMPCGTVAYGPRGGRDPVSLWPVADTPADVSSFTIIRCRGALSRAWPDLVRSAHPIGTHNRDARAFNLTTV
jgi:hypothetical protein